MNSPDLDDLETWQLGIKTCKNHLDQLDHDLKSWRDFEMMGIGFGENHAQMAKHFSCV